ncbi:hypothetical protein BJX61DRAFT_6958 [Aspergillus egyptiacus]|nr:hypothetical protein BJX61DRAFT_6958 [Aspergillus egyptiacus]
MNFSPSILKRLGRKVFAGPDDSAVNKERESEPPSSNYSPESDISTKTLQQFSFSRSPSDAENPRLSGCSRTLHDEVTPGSSDTGEFDAPDPQPGSPELSFCLSEPLDIVVRFRGDPPAKNKLMAAWIDTQCRDTNLMNIDKWHALNEDNRGVLEPADNEYVKPLGPERIPVLGIVRGLEWHFRDGTITYVSDFRLIQTERFDVLIGDNTINKHKLVLPGDDLRRHLTKGRERKEALRRRWPEQEPLV